VNAIEQLLSRVPVTEGFVGLHLVDAATGQILASLDPPAAERSDPPDPPEPSARVIEALATATTDIVRLVSGMIMTHDVDGELEDLVITLTGHHHLVRPLPPSAGAESTFLLLSLDRARSNLALARHLLLAFEARLVA
jgi:hypothetical protein